jgi:hypothetical protein
VLILFCSCIRNYAYKIKIVYEGILKKKSGIIIPVIFLIKKLKLKNMKILKRLALLIVALALQLNLIAYHYDNLHQGRNYCAKLKDGVIVVMYQDNPITSDVILNNGSVIKPDGTVITKDGNKFILKDGECIDQGGAIPVKKKN